MNMKIGCDSRESCLTCHADLCLMSGGIAMPSGDVGVPSPRPLTPPENAFCGALAGVFSRFVIAPLDVVKIRLQTESRGKYGSMLHAFRVIAREEGLRGFWKGNGAAVILYCGYGAVQFSTFAECKRMLIERDRRLGHDADAAGRKAMRDFMSGAAAGTAATVVTYPFDLLRTRLALQSSEHRVRRRKRVGRVEGAEDWGYEGKRGKK